MSEILEKVEPASEAENDEDERVGASMSTKVGIGFGVALGAVAIGSFVLYRMMNRTHVSGLEHVPSSHDNVLYCLNHNSMLDNFAFETMVYLPKVFFSPDHLPVNLADRKNFFGDPKSRRFKDKVLTVLGKYFFTRLRAYPVDRMKGDLAQVDQWIELLKQNIVVVFPEGTRSRTGEIGEGKPGIGKLIYKARPTVIPVRMSGSGDVLPVGSVIPRVFQRVDIVIGEPLDLGELLDRPFRANARTRSTSIARSPTASSTPSALCPSERRTEEKARLPENERVVHEYEGIYTNQFFF
jgi:1-acyl-sn-glycerol-3-phosphate acyltransferase